MTTYTTQDENELCRAIHETGTKKYWEMVDTLADLLHVTPDHTRGCGGKAVEESLFRCIAHAQGVYEEHKPIFKHRGLDISPVIGYTTGRYRKTYLIINNVEDNSHDVIQIGWISFNSDSYPNCCRNLPKPPELAINAEDAMKTLTKTLHYINTIIRFIVMFRDTEHEIKQVEDEERKNRIIKYSHQLELLKQL